jgi:hypothetical protein
MDDWMYVSMGGWKDGLMRWIDGSWNAQMDSTSIFIHNIPSHMYTHKDFQKLCSVYY